LDVEAVKYCSRSVAAATSSETSKAIHDSTIGTPNRRAGGLPLIHNSKVVEKYSASVW
jgi:hypothetical protein